MKRTIALRLSKRQYLLIGILLAGLSIRLLLFCGDGLGDDSNYFSAFKNIYDGKFLNSQYYHRFSYWIPQVLIWKFLGINEFTFLLPILLSSLGCICLVYCIGKELFGTAVGLIGASLMAVHPFEVLNATLFSTDVNLSLYMLCCVYFFLLAQRSYRHVYFFLSALFLLFSFVNKPFGIFIVLVLPVLILIKERRLRDMLRYWPMALWSVALFTVLLLGFWKLTGDPLEIINIYYTREPFHSAPIDRYQLSIYPKQMFLKSEFGERFHGFHFYAVVLCLFFVRRTDWPKIFGVLLWFMLIFSCHEFLPQKIEAGQWLTAQRIFRYFVIVVPPSVIWLAYFWGKWHRLSPRTFFVAFLAYLSLSVFWCWDSTRYSRIAFGEVREALVHLKGLGDVDIYADDYFLSKYQRLMNAGNPDSRLHFWRDAETRHAWRSLFQSVSSGYVVTGGPRLPYYGCYSCIPNLGDFKPPPYWTLVKEFNREIFPPWKLEALRIWKVSSCEGLSGDVSIADPEFEACLRQSVRPLRPQDGLQPGQPISRDRACRVTRIECESRGIKEVNGIENFTHLTVLNLNYNQLTRIDISELMEIEMLLLGRNKLTDIGDISRLSRMHTLWLGYNELRSLKLDGLTNLKDLRVDGNQLKEITGLQTNPNLDILVLSQNPELPCQSLGISAALLAASGCGTR